MRISELRLERFGHFSDVTLPFDRGPGRSGLTLLHGANEAGKSTLLAALRAFLFGFPRGAAWDFRWPSETLAVGGTLAFADGAIAEVRREKKRGLRGQLHDVEHGDVALDDELLRARLGRPSMEMFSTVFAFSLEDLARGGEALRDEGLRAAIAGAGLGAARSPQAVIKELRDQADALFTVKGRAGKLINATLADIKERELERRRVEARGEDYEARVRARDAARGEAEALGARRRVLLTSIGEREALARALPRRDELRGARAERAALPPTTLPPDAGDAFARARQEKERLHQHARELADKQARVARQVEKLTLDDALLDAAPRIRPLHEGLGRHAEESRQAEELAAAHRTRRLELGRQLGELRRGWALDDLDVLPHPLFTSGLERLREGWSGHTERARELERLTAARQGLGTRRLALRKRLDPPWPLPAQDADPAFLPVPRAEELKHHKDALAACERAIADLSRDDDRLREEARALEGQLARLDVGGAVPSTEELARLRAARDAAWSALKAAANKNERAALGDAFETALRAADAHADELRRRSDDVAKRAELALRRAEIARARADRATSLQRAAAERAAAEAAWRELWARCGFVPQSPETMLEWLSDYAELRKLDGDLARVDEQAAALAGAEDDYARRLGAILETFAFDRRTELAQAKRIVDTVLAVRLELEELRRDEERAKRLAANVAGWRNEVKRLCAELAPALAPLAATDATAAMRALAARLAEAQEAARLRAQLESQEEELAAEAAETARAERQAAAALAAWRARAGVDDDDTFVHAAAAARRRDTLDREIAALERALAEARGAVAAEAFASALESAERGIVDSELADARAELDRVDAEFRAASERVGAAEEALKQLDGGARAAEIGAGVEYRRASLRGLVQQYAVVTLSRALLERQVARFQERHQPRMIEELSSLFCALTEGRYTRVYPRYDDEGTFVAVRRDGVEVAPPAMSTGTREQLWLAVRLAYVRQYCDASEPLPLVLDDPLVNFDAARARATLSVLADFARRSQVVMLTCHAHLVALSREVAAVEPIDVPAPN
ncbi:MAG TPA: AAA family ATPase [Polyangia bacterium]